MLFRSIEGYLDRCTVLAQNPEGYGFGEAALQMVPQFAMTPKVRNGRAVEGEVTIPIDWADLPSLDGAPPTSRLISDPDWTMTPTAAQIKAAYPAKAAELTLGQAALRCKIDPQGKPRACDIVSEIPKGAGFGAAAKSLAGSFKIAFKPEEASDLKNLDVDIPFHFRNPTAVDNGRLTEPRWTQTLSADSAMLLFPRKALDAKVITGVAVVDCAATAEGKLTDCHVTRETPPELGFGDAVLKAATAMQMNPWTKTGDAVEGRRLALPIRLTVPAAAVEQAPPKP